MSILHASTSETIVTLWRGFTPRVKVHIYILCDESSHAYSTINIVLIFLDSHSCMILLKLSFIY